MKSRIFSVTLALLMLAAGPASLNAESGQECIRAQVRTAVTVAAQGLSAVLKDTAADERLDLLRAYVDAVRFLPDKSGYFFVYTYGCVNVAHAVQPELVGKDLMDYQDPEGKFVIRELSAAANQGGGFVDYVWPKPGEKGQHPKVGYAAPIKGTDWFIGSGCYGN